MTVRTLNGTKVVTPRSSIVTYSDGWPVGFALLPGKRRVRAGGVMVSVRRVPPAPAYRTIDDAVMPVLTQSMVHRQLGNDIDP